MFGFGKLSRKQKRWKKSKANNVSFLGRNVWLETINSTALDTSKIPVDCFIKVMNLYVPH